MTETHATFATELGAKVAERLIREQGDYVAREKKLIVVFNHQYECLSKENSRYLMRRKGDLMVSLDQ